MRSALVVSEVALSLTLLVGAMLLIRSYQNLRETDLGFAAEDLVTFGLFVPAASRPEAADARRVLGAVEERLRTTAGVSDAGAISSLPLVFAGPPDDFVIEGRTPQPGQAAWNARYIMATPGAFTTLRVPLKRGRLIGTDDIAGRQLVAVINETAARQYWPNDDPIGRRIKYYPVEESPWITIVGVVGDTRSISVAEPPPPAVYVPHAQAPREAYEGRGMTFIARGPQPDQLAGAARAAVASVDDTLPLAELRSMTAVVGRALGQPRFTMLVMGFFATSALFLGALGLYGVLAYGVEQRTREIGIRIALGAHPREVFRLVVTQGLRLVAVGMAIGLPTALAVSRLIEILLVGVSGHDPMTYVQVIAALALTALLASWLPARRATTVDPIVALRSE